MWSDGSKFNYENWAQEDEKEENEHCLKMNYEGNKTPSVHTKVHVPLKKMQMKLLN